MARQKPKVFHYVVVGRRSVRIVSALRALLKGHPEFKVIVDRRRGDRRQSSGARESERRKGKDRRM